MSFPKCRSWLSAVFTVVAPLCVGAQEIQGTIVQSDSVTPAGGVVVVLLHPTRDDSIVARGITSERGTFALRAAPGTVRLRALRVGYAPMNAGSYTLTAGNVQSVRILLNDARVQLNAVNVNDTRRCDVRPEGATLVAQLFTEARTALLASTATVYGREIQSQSVNFLRHEDTRGRLVSPVERTTFSSATLHPYQSLDADSLAKFGYAVPVSDGMVYYAPDANVLLSDAFAVGHCLQLVVGTGDRLGSIGIGFRPVNRAQNLVDISGTLWLDRATSELQGLEYLYDNLLFEGPKVNAGGRVDYMRMSNGSWFVNKWSIRKPVLGQPRAQDPDEIRLGGQLELKRVVMAVLVNGGEVQSVRVDNNVLFLNASAALVGATGAEIAAGMLATSSQTAVSDLTFRGLPECGGGTGEYVGAIQGTVFNAARDPLANAKVSASWKDDFKLAQSRDQTSVTWQNRELSTNTTQSGSYMLCGAPVVRSIALIAERGRQQSPWATLRLTKLQPVGKMDFVIAEPGVPSSNARAGSGAGTVPGAVAPPSVPLNRFDLIVTDASGQPVPHAAIILNGGAAQVTDDNGIVAMRNARDSLNLVVRRIGYEPFQGKLIRGGPAEPFRLTLLPTSRRLDAIEIRDPGVKTPLEQTGFYERMLDVQKSASSGEFFTPEDLDARPGMKITQFLQGSRFAKVTRYNGPGAGADKRVQMIIEGPRGCYMQILLDGVPARGLVGDPNDGGTASIDDVVNAPEIMAVEVYPDAANAPVSIASKARGNACGIVVLWTGSRR